MTETLSDTSSIEDAHRTLFDAGLVVRREVLGEDYVNAALAHSAGSDGEPLQEYVSETVWGAVWTRPGLDRRSRSLITLGMLVALNQPQELAVHVRAGLRNGVTREEVVEAVIHGTAYAGVPAGVAAMRVVQEALNAHLGPLNAEEEVYAARIPLPHSKVGFIGLGAMGSPIARNLVGAGQPIVVHDADPEARQRFIDDNPTAIGAEATTELADCDIVVLVLPNSDIVDQVVLADGGLLSCLKPGSILVDMGSSVPARTQAIEKAAALRGIDVVDAPVSGGVARARNADLAVMVGGDQSAIDTVLPLLESTGRQIIHVGPVGSGHAAKALNNLLAANGLMAAGEALLVGRKFGIDPATLLSVINAGSGRNQATETKYENFVLSRSFASGFSAQLMRKDIGIALDLARQLDASTVLGDALGRVWGEAVEDLDPAADQTEVVRYLEKLSAATLDENALPSLSER